MNLTDSYIRIHRKKLCEHTHVYLSCGIITNDAIATCYNAQNASVPERFDNQIIAEWNWTYPLTMRSQRSWAISLKLDDTCFETEYLAEISPNFASRRYISKSSIYVLAKNFALNSRTMHRDTCFSTSVSRVSHEHLLRMKTNICCF